MDGREAGCLVGVVCRRRVETLRYDTVALTGLYHVVAALVCVSPFGRLRVTLCVALIALPFRDRVLWRRVCSRGCFVPRNDHVNLSITFSE